MSNLQHQVIAIGPTGNNCHQTGEVKLATFDASDYLNIYVHSSEKARGYVCVTAAEAKQVRDALLKLYPVDNSSIINAAKAVSYGEGYRDGFADQPVTAPWRWEVVTDGLDRVKVEGGYIYQSDGGEMLFVPSTNELACTLNGACQFQKKG